MQDVLLKKIAELERELDDLYSDFEASDYTHYGKHVTLQAKILKKSEELTALKNGLSFIQAV